ncbi:hypothetical protein [Streptomyces cinnamoneus]|uniref:Uncharacterized protein n=1 Tax=Streptomyces cinnamoneus TaxID=53446 RepID=A0A918TKF7_STRCJ|nr:hypothetical protein [Streptomyces cinnamoneus]GHC48955.1 hypothetical protein GCM10010507_25760 [Streptomyces cinnamoneus]
MSPYGPPRPPDRAPGERVDQVVFRWAGNRTGRAGIAAVAQSCDEDQAHAMADRLGAILRVMGGEQRPSTVRLGWAGKAVLLRRTPGEDAHGRGSTVCHALVAPPKLLQPRFCIALGAAPWAEDGWADSVTGPLDTVPHGLLGTWADAAEQRLAPAVALVGRPLECLVAQLLRTPADRVSARTTELPALPVPAGAAGPPDAALPVLLGLCDVFGRWLRGSWTYATHDTVDSHGLRVVFVPHWRFSHESDLRLRRIDLTDPGPDTAAGLARRLVRHYLAHIAATGGSGDYRHPLYLARDLDPRALGDEARYEAVAAALDGRRPEPSTARRPPEWPYHPQPHPQPEPAVRPTEAEPPPDPEPGPEPEREPERSPEPVGEAEPAQWRPWESGYVPTREPEPEPGPEPEPQPAPGSEPEREPDAGAYAPDGAGDAREMYVREQVPPLPARPPLFAPADTGGYAQSHVLPSFLDRPPSPQHRKRGRRGKPQIRTSKPPRQNLTATEVRDLIDRLKYIARSDVAIEQYRQQTHERLLGTSDVDLLNILTVHLPYKAQNFVLETLGDIPRSEEEVAWLAVGLHRRNFLLHSPAPSGREQREEHLRREAKVASWLLGWLLEPYAARYADEAGALLRGLAAAPEGTVECAVLNELLVDCPPDRLPELPRVVWQAVIRGLHDRAVAARGPRD